MEYANLRVNKRMKFIFFNVYNNMLNTGLLVALCVLIIMLLICHTMNFLYPRSNFNNILPTKYNKITYETAPCENQARIPCNIKKRCPTPTQYTLSDSELAVLYKEAYEMAGQEILNRTINEQQ